MGLRPAGLSCPLEAHAIGVNGIRCSVLNPGRKRVPIVTFHQANPASPVPYPSPGGGLYIRRTSHHRTNARAAPHRYSIANGNAAPNPDSRTHGHAMPRADASAHGHANVGLHR